MKKTSEIEKNAARINKYLNSKIKKRQPNDLYDAARHLIINGGKRLRPYMTIKSCELLGGDTSKAISAASALEMIHNFTLIQDDIIDNDEMRHGVMTVHKKFGVPVAILSSDVLFAKAFQVISESTLSTSAIIKMTSMLSRACIKICEGQILDVQMAQEKKMPTLLEYIKMIEKKTAVLFDVSCAMGAICASDKVIDITNLSTFGRNLGIVFQITDDIIGVMGDSNITKKPVGNDIREGKKSLPILLALKSATGNDKRLILKSFGNSKVTKSDLMKTIEVIRTLEIEKDVKKQARKYAKKAEKSLAMYNGKAKSELITLMDFVIKRKW